MDNAVDLGNEENPFAPAADEPKPKRQTGPRTFNEGDLCDKDTGLNALYTDLVLKRDKLNMKGKGHEL